MDQRKLNDNANTLVDMAKVRTPPEELKSTHNFFTVLILSLFFVSDTFPLKFWINFLIAQRERDFFSSCMEIWVLILSNWRSSFYCLSHFTQQFLFQNILMVIKKYSKSISKISSSLVLFSYPAAIKFRQIPAIIFVNVLILINVFYNVI